MRTADEMRERWLRELPLILRRPGMYATDGQNVDVFLSMRMRDMCFLDDRDADDTGIRTAMLSYGKLGVVGPFQAVFGERSPYTDEVASVWAEVFHRLGYLAVDRLLGPAERAPLTGLRDWIADRDVRRGEVLDTFGPPSFEIGRNILCYAPDDGSGWTFFDCFGEPAQRYRPGKGDYTCERDEDPLVRDARVPAEGFEDGLILTLYGRVLRWGPGWWIDHPGDTARSPET